MSLISLVKADPNGIYASTTPAADAVPIMGPGGSLNVGPVYGLNPQAGTKTANYTASVSDRTIICDTTSGVFTVTLPPVANTPDGTRMTIINIATTGTHDVTLDGNASETINGATTQAVAYNYGKATIEKYGGTSGAWMIVG